jgi:hypothetical protein
MSSTQISIHLSENVERRIKEKQLEVNVGVPSGVDSVVTGNL